jgi:hypothetical protein
MSEANSGRENPNDPKSIAGQVDFRGCQDGCFGSSNDLKLVMSVLEGDSSAIYPEVVVSVRNLVDGILETGELGTHVEDSVVVNSVGRDDIAAAALVCANVPNFPAFGSGGSFEHRGLVERTKRLTDDGNT